MSPEQGSRITRPAPKRSRVKPSRHVPPRLQEIIPHLKCYVWKDELKWDQEKREWVRGRRARSPKTLDVILWGEESWEKSLNLWGSFEEAHGAFRKNEDLQGIGFVVEPERAVRIGGKEPCLVHIVFFDLDDCRNPETGEVEPWAQEIVKGLDTYAEVSPSGKGIRAIGFVKEPQNRGCVFYTPDGRRFLRPKGKKDGYHRAEIYGGNGGRRCLISFTGAVLEGFDRPVREVRDWIDAGIPKNSLPEADKTDAVPEPLDLPDKRMLEVMFSSKDGALMRRFMAGDESLWKGKDASYKRRSHADLGFFRKLAFYARGNKERIYRIALSSGMRREERWSPDYLNDNVEKAISSCNGDFYDPAYSSAQEGDRKVPRAKVDLSDGDLLRKLAETKRERFARLWEGDEGLWEESGPYEDLEAAQLGLCSMLSFVAGNDEGRVDRLFRDSGLYRENWEDENYRTRTLKKALSAKIYEPGWRPDNGARDSQLDVLDEIRLGLPWGMPGGMHGCYVYRALIGKGQIDGRPKEEFYRELDLNVVLDVFDDEFEIAVEATDRGLMLGSGLYSKSGITMGKKIVEEAGLVKTLKKGAKEKPSIYLLRSPKNMPKRIIPYPPGFVGTEEDCDAFAVGMERVQTLGVGALLHPLELLDFRRTRKSVPKKPFRSPLNSMACHDTNLKNLVLRTRVDGDHPDKRGGGMYKNKSGEWEGYFVLHPPSALSPPFNEPVLHFEMFVTDHPMDRATRLKLLHTEGLSSKQKFVVEQVDHGRQSLLDLEKFLGEARRDNFRARSIDPLVKKGLLKSFQDELYGECYDKTEDFEENLEDEYIRSSSAERRKEVREWIGRQRKVYRDRQERWEKNRKRAEEEQKRTREFFEFLMETNKNKRGVRR